MQIPDQEARKLAEQEVLTTLSRGYDSTNFIILRSLPATTGSVRREVGLTRMPFYRRINLLSEAGLLRHRKGEGKLERTPLGSSLVELVDTLTEQAAKHGETMVQRRSEGVTDRGEYKKRLMIFIDGSDLLHAAPFQVDLLALRALLSRGANLIRAYFYSSTSSSDENSRGKQQRFFDFLSQNGFDVVTLPLRRREGKHFEKGVEIALTVDLLGLACRGAYDDTILVAGDSDYVRAVEEAKSIGKRMEVAFFTQATSRELRHSADYFTALEDLRESIELKKSQ